VLNTVHIIEVLDHATAAVNRVQPAFFATFNEQDAVNHFYEPFLEAFDPELRKQLGVWYTPREIVRYMVERVDHLLRTELHEPLGLASPNVQVLDPCCGTGAYLVEVLHRIEATLRQQAGDDDALIGADLRRAATTRIFGFEIMPAPFVIAHLQVAKLLEQAGASLTATQRAQVFLTNALTGWESARHPQSNFGFPAFTAERDTAEAVKQADTILVILGNPPYNGYAGIALGEERDLSEAYRSAVPGLPAPQGQGLNELYVRFFRIAERRITQNRGHRGIFSFISNYSWLDGLSHPTMRHHLLHSFDTVYIDNLHGDRRISEYAPDGRTSETVFAMQGTSVGIKVGTAIATLVKNSQSNAASSLQYRDFDNARAAERRQHLLESSRREENYASLEPNPILGLPFKPRTVTTDYLDWPRLMELFPVFFAGVQTKRDALLIDISRSTLERRIAEYLNPDLSHDIIRRRLPYAMHATARFRPEETRESLYRNGFKPWQITRHLYRPFDARWAYWEPTTRLLGEKSADYVNHHFGSMQIIAQQKPRAESDAPQAARTQISLDLVDRGASTFPEQTIEVVDILTRRLEVRSNISPAGQLWLTEVAGQHQDLFFHALATMHTPQYRTENSGAFLGDWPRIPLPATADLLTRSATLGRRLANLLDPESDLQLHAEWSFLARLSIPPEQTGTTPEQDDHHNAARFALTAGWGGAGQGATVMPRRGDARERDWTPTELARLTKLATNVNPQTTQSLTLEDALSLLGHRCVDIYLNDSAHWAAVPVNVWD
jgi:predicted helicase